MELVKRQTTEHLSRDVTQKDAEMRVRSVGYAAGLIALTMTTSACGDSADRRVCAIYAQEYHLIEKANARLAALKATDKSANASPLAMPDPPKGVDCSAEIGAHKADVTTKALSAHS